MSEKAGFGCETISVVSKQLKFAESIFKCRLDFEATLEATVWH